MLCDECNENEGLYTVSVMTEEGSGVRHLCADCMEKMQQNLVSGNVRSLLSTILAAFTDRSHRGSLRQTEDVPETDEENETSDLDEANDGNRESDTIAVQEIHLQVSPVSQEKAPETAQNDNREANRENINDEDTCAYCSHCFTSISTTMRTGRMGCAYCYQVFGHQAKSGLAKLKAPVPHVGRRPLTTEAAQQGRILQEQLTRQMQDAVLREDFEEAARLRDQLRSISLEGVQR